MYFVYILQSVDHDFLYIGHTSDLSSRLEQHNNKLVLSTKANAPYKLLSYIAVNTRARAIKIEKYFKSGSGRAVLYKRILDIQK